MKYSVPRQLNPSGELDGIIFFAQRFEEMLSKESIDLNKMPLLNTCSLATEYCQVTQKVSSGDIKEYQRDAVFEEFIFSFKHDIVLKENWGQSNIEQVVKSFGSCNQKDKDNIFAYLAVVLNDGKYLRWAKNTILKYTALPKEKKNIEAALRCLLPELISWGYDPEFISATLKAYFFSGRLINHNTVKEFLDVFDLKTHNYMVYFSVSAVVQQFKTILETRLPISFEDDGNYHFFKRDRNKTVIRFNDISARCPDTAAKRAHDILDMFLSFYKYVGNKKSVAMQNKAMVIEKGNNPCFVSSKPSAFSIVEEKNDTEIGTLSDNLITGLLSNAEDEYPMLSKALELHNTALSVVDMKSGFLNLWSALEVLSQDHNSKSKLSPVLELVLPILKKDYILTQVQEFRKGIKDNLSVEDYDYILSKITITGCEKKKLFHLIFTEEYALLREELYDKLSSFPVLRSRLSLLSDFNTTKKLSKAIDLYMQRINWHLHRTLLPTQAMYLRT